MAVGNGQGESARFDEVASRYRRLHSASIGASGESTEYFARYKLDCLLRRGVPLDAPLLDYGSGIGLLAELLVEHFHEVHGYDPSQESTRLARERAPEATFHHDPEDVPDDHFGTAVLAGVLHHVPPSSRRDVLSIVRRKLQPGGRIVVFEHNPLNPLTRRAVSLCAFDDDAVLLWPWQVRRALRDAAYGDIELDYIVFFPRPFAFLRRLEPKLGWLPAGAQTMTVGTRRP